jgi:hypothetical protein
MNKVLKIIGTGAVAAVVAFFVLLLSGLGTTGLADVEGNWVSLTTVQLGTNEFGVLMILAVFVSVVAAGFAFNAIDKN